MNESYKEIESIVFPSEEKTIAVKSNAEYGAGGAHDYEIQVCKGSNPNTKITEYIQSTQRFKFMQKNEDGSIIPGLQSE